MEDLLSQSAKGIHLLFDRESLSQILSTATDEQDFFSFQNVSKVQKIFVDFMQHETAQAKKAYISTLDKETYELLVRAYFNIVENTIFEHTRLKH